MQYRSLKPLKKILNNSSRNITSTTQSYISREKQYGAANYEPLPVVLKKGLGIYLWDVDDKQYMDFLSAYSAVNQGHCHPRIVAKMTEQSSTLTLTSRAFYSDALAEYSEFVTKYFGMERLLPMNSGVEACETAIKLARRWSYMVKGIPENQAQVIVAKNNFWGRSIAAISSSTDPDSFTHYGPFVPGFTAVDYNDIEAIKAQITDKTAAVMLEPIQGEAGVVVPDPGYLKAVRKLCDEKNVLFICDEIQAGLGRTGKRMCIDWEDCKPDIVTLGKALSGGMLPVSAVLSSSEVMNTLSPGTHGSTYGGNPLACKVAMEALKVLEDENMCENSRIMGEKFREGIRAINSPLVSTVRGKGLFTAVVITETKETNAKGVCMKMMDMGMLAKPTHGDTIRLAPPLIINESQISNSLEILEKALKP